MRSALRGGDVLRPKCDVSVALMRVAVAENGSVVGSGRVGGGAVHGEVPG